jgi:hypothetical protein
MMSRPSWRWPAIIGAGTVAACVAAALGGSSPAQSLAVVAFLLVCPGMAVVRWIGVGDVWSQLSLGLALSVAIDTLVAGAMALVGLWSPAAILVILAVVSLAGAAQELRGRGAQEQTA